MNIFTLFLKMVTLNLSKSLSYALFSFLIYFVAAPNLAYLSVSANFVNYVLMKLLLDPLSTDLTANLVKVSLLIGIIYLLTPVVGPSISTLLSFKISTMTANLPSSGP